LPDLSLPMLPSGKIPAFNEGEMKDTVSEVHEPQPDASYKEVVYDEEQF
jgi:hypothetical protein